MCQRGNWSTERSSDLPKSHSHEWSDPSWSYLSGLLSLSMWSLDSILFLVFFDKKSISQSSILHLRESQELSGRKGLLEGGSWGPGLWAQHARLGLGRKWKQEQRTLGWDSCANQRIISREGGETICLWTCHFSKYVPKCSGEKRNFLKGYGVPWEETRLYLLPESLVNPNVWAEPGSNA